MKLTYNESGQRSKDPSVDKLLKALSEGDVNRVNRLMSRADNQQFRQEESQLREEEGSQRRSIRDARDFARGTLSFKKGEGEEKDSIQRDVSKLLDNLEDPQGTLDKQKIKKQLMNMVLLAGAGRLTGGVFKSLGVEFPNRQ